MASSPRRSPKKTKKVAPKKPAAPKKAVTPKKAVAPKKTVAPKKAKPAKKVAAPKKPAAKAKRAAPPPDVTTEAVLSSFGFMFVRDDSNAEREGVRWEIEVPDEEPFELFVALLGGSQLSVYLVFRQRVPRERMVTVLEAIARVNHGLLVGSYEVDIEEGFVRLKAGLDFTGTELQPALVLNLVTTVRDISNVYDESIMSVMNAELTPSEAVALVEG